MSETLKTVFDVTKSPTVTDNYCYAVTGREPPTRSGLRSEPLSSQDADHAPDTSDPSLIARPSTRLPSRPPPRMRISSWVEIHSAEPIALWEM